MRWNSSEELRYRLKGLAIVLGYAENIAGSSGVYNFYYKLVQDELPHRSTLGITHLGSDVVTMSYLFDKSMTPQISTGEADRIQAMLIRELVGKTRAGVEKFLANQIAYGITHHFQIKESECGNTGGVLEEVPLEPQTF